MTLQELLTAAVRDFEAHGFDSEERLAFWEKQIRDQIAKQLRPAGQMEQMLHRHMRAIYERVVMKGGALKYHEGLGRFKLNQLAGRLHSELDRRIMASAQLIKLNRTEMINKTIQRFSGWATSVPKGGSDTIDKTKIKAEVAKPLARLPFTERRVLIDQGHKLNSSINAVLASDGGAIAARWMSHWRQAGYDYRPDHKARDGKIYLIRDSWALREGLVKVGEDGWSDAITQPAEEPYCQCRFVYLYNLRQLPKELLTKKGVAALERLDTLRGKE